MYLWSLTLCLSGCCGYETVLSEAKQNQMPVESFQKSLEGNSFLRRGPEVSLHGLENLQELK